MTEPYVPLRIHTPYSIGKGAIHSKELAKRLIDWNVPAAASTDINTLAGAYTFKDALKSKGVQPIQGIEITVSHPGITEDIETSTLALYAKNEKGYRQICSILSIANLEQRPVELTEILQHREETEFLVLTGGIDGPIDKALAIDAPHRAQQRLKSLKNALGNNLYCEIQRQSGPNPYDQVLAEMASAMQIPCIATSDAWFLDKDYVDAHDILLCISGGYTIHHQDRPHASPFGYLKSPSEMEKLFADIPTALKNTVEFAKRCSFIIEELKPELPAFPTTGGRSEYEELVHLSKTGLEDRLKQIQLDENDKSPFTTYTRKDYFDRLDFELKVINDMGFPGYFLIVADFIQWSKANNIPVGPGRGSGAGSVVAWALTITDLDPLRYGLYFERFLNPERVSMPDFDIDFCNERRKEVIAYVRDKYGHDRVAQIGTIGKLQARNAFKDTGRVLGIPFPVVNRWASLIPNAPGKPISLSEAMELEPLATELLSADPQILNAFNLGKKIEGLFRDQSTHAAGVVIGNKPLHEIVPVYKDQHGLTVTAFDMKAVEKASLVKFDFLGLKTLDIINETINLANSIGDKIDLNILHTQDPDTYEMLRAGDAFGVFQLESEGMRRAMSQIQPKTIEDIIALVALYRPGPMENIPRYAEVNSGQAEATYLIPQMKDTLEETKGIIVYQEQVMKLAQDLAGYTLGGADKLRRAMGKKIQAEMDAQRDVFLAGAKERGISSETATEIFDLINKFANYGFNKSHAAAYALIAYQTAYLRKHHPETFMAASMNLDISDTDKIADALENARQSNFPTLHPDINHSKAMFSVELQDGIRKIRHGFAAMKGVGVAVANQIVTERTENGRYTTLSDFINRTRKFINKKTIEALIASGALDKLYGSVPANRNSMMTVYPEMLKDAVNREQEEKRGQTSMFDMLVDEQDRIIPFPDIKEWPTTERLRRQFDAVGFYIDGHPIEAQRKTLNRRRNSVLISTIKANPDSLSGRIGIGGIIVDHQLRKTKGGDPMIILKVSDETGVMEIVAFKDMADEAKDVFQGSYDGKAGFFELDVSRKNDDISLFLRDIEPINMDVA